MNNNFSLDKINRTLLEQYGSKIVALAELHQENFNVPAGIGVSCDFFNEFCRHNNIILQNKKSVAQAILKGAFSDILKTELQRIWNIIQTHPGNTVIVRSSAIEEDGSAASFAGIYNSIINVRTFNNFGQAVKECWSSFFSEQAVVYRDENNIQSGGFAILVQEFIEGDKSGVLFTTNFMSYNKNEIIIEACRGLNTGIIDNKMPADRYILNRKYEIEQESIPSKKVKYSLAENAFSLQTEMMPPEQWNEPVLTASELKILAQLGHQVEQIYKTPVDIEWTMKDDVVFILQCRPVTTLPNRAIVENIYFDADIPDNVECTLLDRYSEPAATCYLSLLQLWEDIVYLSFYSKKRGCHFNEKPLHFYFNRVYWNLKYQSEQFDDVAFNEKGWRALWKKAKLIHLMLTKYKNWNNRLRKYDLHIKRFSQYKLEQMDIQALNTLLKNVTDVFCDFIGIDHYQILGLAGVTYNLLQKKLSALPDSKEIILNILHNSVSKNKTVQSNNELLEFAKTIYANRELREIFTNESASNILDILKNTEWREYNRQFDLFLQKHGHRGTSCDDLYTPHWIEEPAFVIELIKQFIINSPDKILFNEPNESIDNQYFTSIAKAVSGQKHGIFKRYREQIFVINIMKLTIQYMMLRENQRYYFDKSWLIMRRIILRIGEILVQHGQIKDKLDIFHFTIEEIYQLSSDSANNPERIIDRRKKVYERNKLIRPPYFIKNNEFVKIQKHTLKTSYKATGISPGIAGGKVTILSSIEDLGKVSVGDIVIVSTFHPSWTPILKIVSGLVMNYGNLLSHGAVVAREFMIPVVVFNGNATHLFDEGSWIEINGTTGRIKTLNTGQDITRKKDIYYV